MIGAANGMGGGMQKVRISDICTETGLSRSTVDRALNGRGKVHPRTAATIQETVQQLSRTAGAIHTNHAMPVDVLLRLGSGMTRQMKRTFEAIKGPKDRYFDLFQLNEETVLRQLTEICSDRERAAVVTVKDTERIRSLLTKARQSGKRIIALISELGPDACDGYIGIDNKSAGAAAAYLVVQAIGDRPSTVGIVVGDHSFRCHEDREIGFRASLREIGRRVVLAGEARGEDNAERTYLGVLRMLETHPGISAIYNVSGGNQGLVRALREVKRDQDIIAMCHELTDVSVPLLHDNSLNFIFSQDPYTLLTEALKMARATTAPGDVRAHIDFGFYTRYNLPRYARDLDLSYLF